MAYEAQLRAKTKRCPTCKVKLTDTPFLPNSKELDHIIPINVGGTHTVGNVRIICRECNQQRPKDGSDFTGQPTLWAQDPIVADALAASHRQAERIHRCMDCGRGVVSGWKYCEVCRPRVPNRTAEEIATLGHAAAKLRAQQMSWQDIADLTGVRNTGTTYIYAKKHGDPSDLERWPRRYRRSRLR